ncbi:hypothetical protein B0T10DRAFT_611005 [Thelonectria olida]|uniref:Uncharacterized protein n=1 Tax=Thelonectria olida TaxID=1576542 RepID=A0A9P8VSH9_9HYPO|nr:hypothetical protein B0T10DRAFT_611005 [Thelonectria olida]
MTTMLEDHTNASGEATDYFRRLQGKTALVTGSGRGIGKAIALAFAGAGCNVACVSRTNSEVVAVANSINSTTAYEARAFVCDVSDISSLPALIREIKQWINRPISILVNNAGLARIEALEFERDITSWQQIIATNLTAPAALSYAILPDMLSSEDGVIMSVGSRNAIYNIPYMNAYSVSKTGLLRFHENLERELSGKGVCSYYVVPGNVQTSILAGKGTVDEKSIRHSAGARRMVEAIATCEKTSAEKFAAICVKLAVDKRASLLSGRYIDTEGDLAAVFEDVQNGNESKCVKEGLYKLKVDKL